MTCSSLKLTIISDGHRRAVMAGTAPTGRFPCSGLSGWPAGRARITDGSPVLSAYCRRFRGGL